ncbi:MAG: HEAT repeat domain-containing protein [Arenicella sp.]|nr:HEAT repeat domain-containing protein [Arenicella sp.]
MSNLKYQSIITVSLTLLLLLITLPAHATSKVMNGEQKLIEFHQSIAKTIDAVATNNGQWFSYQVAMEPNNGMPCCLISDTESSCSLDNRVNSQSYSMRQSDNSKRLNIYFKINDGTPSDLFLAGKNCNVKVGGNTVYKIDNVAQKPSISFLNELIEGDTQNTQISYSALAAIALHQGSDAHTVLESFANSETKELKHDSIFWLGQARNNAGYESLLTIVDDDTKDNKVRGQAVFALSVNSHENASKKLVQLAKHSANEAIQTKSVFWLAQNHKSKAINVIDYILLNSDNNAVRKKTVLALAQIRSKVSWQRLVGLAQTAADIEVQREAIFWLSQNEDENPRSILVALAKSKSPASVKKKAVFALSQLKPSQSTPALSELIETATEASIKKEAFFWLGQSDDPKALDYLERVLTSNR